MQMFLRSWKLFIGSWKHVLISYANFRLGLARKLVVNPGSSLPL
jgi:hypothetical protein